MNTQVKIFGVEPTDANAMALSLHHDQRVILAEIPHSSVLVQANEASRVDTSDIEADGVASGAGHLFAPDLVAPGLAEVAFEPAVLAAGWATAPTAVILSFNRRSNTTASGRRLRISSWLLTKFS